LPVYAVTPFVLVGRLALGPFSSMLQVYAVYFNIFCFFLALSVDPRSVFRLQQIFPLKKRIVLHDLVAAIEKSLTV